MENRFMTENFRVVNFRFHEDEKAQRLIDILPESNREGQINICYYRQGTFWHRHKHQTDYDICIKGAFQIGLVDRQYEESRVSKLEKVSWVFLSEKSPQTLIIPPGVWHAVKPLEPNSIILYYMTQKYNPDDIEEVPIGYFGERW